MRIDCLPTFFLYVEKDTGLFVVVRWGIRNSATLCDIEVCWVLYHNFLILVNYCY